MSKKNVDELFQEKLKDFGETPDERVWQAIASSLDKQKKSKKGIPIWWKVGGLAAGLAVLIYLGYPLGYGEGEEPAVTNIESNTAPAPNGSDTLKDPLVLPENTEDQMVSTPSSLDNDNGTVPANTNSSPDKENVPSSKTMERNWVGADTSKSVKTQNTSPDSYNQNPEVVVGKEHLTELPTRLGDKTKSAEESALRTAVTQTPDKPLKEADTHDINKAKGAEAIAQAAPNKEQENTQKKSIFEAIEEQEKEADIAAKRVDKWAVGPSVAPVYFNAMGEGSPIHSSFVANSKSGQTNLSYGVVVSYGVSEKLRIRSGVHKANYGYNTNEVAFTSLAEAGPGSMMSNIDYSMASRNVIVNSTKTAQFANPGIALDAAPSTASRDGLMAQNFGYLEIPLELNYALLDQKFGIQLIGGFSSLFLTDNSITLESGGLATEVGEANNINTVNFSTNIGFGVNYKFTPQLQLSVEPLFKYQLNTFSQTSGTFNPFSIGVYSGLNFKF